MIKVLWLSGSQLNSKTNFFYETWLSSMAELLIKSKSVELYNICHGDVEEIIYLADTEVKEWVIPKKKSNRTGLPPKWIIKEIEEIVKSIEPDIVHIWGMEKYWGLLTSYGILGENVLLEIQGIKYTCEEVYYGGLSPKELLFTLRIKELIFLNRFLPIEKIRFKRWGEKEKKMIKSHHHIGTQSDWVRHHIEFQNAEAKAYQSLIALRKEFLNPQPWKIRNNESGDIVLMTSSSFATPYKGIHILLDVIELLKRKYSNIKLKIAGDWNINNPFYKKSGYLKWFVSKAQKMGLYESLEFTGPLNASQLLSHFYASDVYIVPSYVESYCLALAEAMSVGIPCVASYIGGMTELGKDNESVLFFPIGDHFKCAGNIDKIISDKALAMKLSENAQKRNQNINKPENVVNRQLEIYNEILTKK